MRTRLSLLLLIAAPLAACGQKGNLYQPDQGIAVTPAAPSAPATPAVSGPDGAPAPSDTATPATPASPDRSDEPRKRIHIP